MSSYIEAFESEDASFQSNSSMVEDNITQQNNNHAWRGVKVINKIAHFCFGRSNDQQGEGNQQNKIYRYLKYLYLACSLSSICFTIWLSYFFTGASRCPYDNDADCFNIYIVGLRFQIKKWATLIILNSLMLLVHINNILFKRLYPIISCFYIILQIYFIYLGDLEISFTNVMGLITVSHYIVFLVLAFIYGITLIACSSFRKNRKITLAVLAVIALSIVLIIATDQCDSQWRKGINGQLQDSKQTCNIKSPPCLLLKAYTLIDLQMFINNCFLGDQYKELYRSKMPENQKKRWIAFPSNLNFLSEDERGLPKMKRETLKNVKSFDTLQQAKKQNKYDVIFDTQEQRYHIDIARNETAVQLNKKLYQNISEQSPPLAKNVIVLFLDAISRYQTHLKLKNFVNWMRKDSKKQSYADNEPQINKQNIKAQSYQFYRYNSLGASSMENTYAMFFGETMDKINTTKYENLKQVNKVSGWEGDYRYHHQLQSFNKLGYMTAAASTWFYYLPVQTYGDEVKNLANARLDHQTMSYNCDPNYFDQQRIFALVKGGAACSRRCLYHNTVAQYALQYGLSFFQKYRDQPKILTFFLIEGHDVIGGTVKYIDDPVTKMLETLQEKGHLEQTLVLVVSDHGQHTGIQTTDHYHPLLMVRLPEKTNKVYREKIRKNQQNLLSAFNIYHFLQHIALGESYKHKDKGLFGDISDQKNCETAYIPLDSQICICK